MKISHFKKNMIMCKEGRQPAVKPVPIKSVPQVSRAREEMKRLEAEERKQHQPSFGQMHGKAIGGLGDPNKWRCKVCKMANEKQASACVRCKEPKTVLIEKAPRNAISSGPQMRFANAHTN